MIEVRAGEILGEPLWGWRVERRGRERTHGLWKIAPKSLRKAPERIGNCGMDFGEACKVAIANEDTLRPGERIRVLPDHPANIL